MRKTLFYLTSLFSLLPTGTVQAVDSATDVVIVGAGSAGLYAAKTLVDRGYKVLILEAKDRIGGRVLSQTLGATRIELGAEEHYLGDGQNPVWPAIRAAYGNGVYVNAFQGLEAYSLDGGSSTCWTGGGANLNCQDEDIIQSFDQFLSTYWDPKRHPNPNTSMADYVAAEYGVASGDRAYHLFNHSFAGGTWATNLDKLGARSVALQDSQWDLSEGIRVLGTLNLGYSDALETVWWNAVIADPRVELRLNSPATLIDTTGNDVIVSDASGDRHAARHVIVTVSIGVLQAERIEFTPPLPADTVAAYQGIGFDQGMKVALRFATPWWKTRGNNNLGWLVTEGLAGACWSPSDYKVGSPDAILMCYPMGRNAAELTTISQGAGGGRSGDVAILQALLQDLDRTFPSAPGGASSTVIDGIVQNWGVDPYTLGAYSFPKIGTYTSKDDSLRLTLQQPVANNRVFFAGEGTHHTHPATVVGALHEGERAAVTISRLNGNPNNPPPLPGMDNPTGPGGEPGNGDDGDASPLIVVQNTYSEGDAVTIQYRAGTGGQRDWIGIYRRGTEPVSGQSHNNYVIWSYTNGTVGSVTFESLPAGDYSAILFANNSWNFLSPVQGSGHANFSVTAETLPPGDGVPPSNTPSAVVSVRKAEYKAKKGELKVEARSTVPQAILTVDGFGPMEGKNGKFKLKLKGLLPEEVPETLTVSSSDGGKVTVAVTLK